MHLSTILFYFHFYFQFASHCTFSFMMVLICLIFSVLSTIDQYTKFANETLFYMVSYGQYHILVSLCPCKSGTYFYPCKSCIGRKPFALDLIIWIGTKINCPNLFQVTLHTFRQNKSVWTLYMFKTLRKYYKCKWNKILNWEVPGSSLEPSNVRHLI